MTNKTLFILAIVATFLVAVGVAQAQMHGFGSGMGSGPAMAQNAEPFGPGSKFYEETSKLRTDMQQKRLELRNLLSASPVDETKAKALQGEITKLHNEMAQKRLAAIIDYKKANPDWQPQSYRGMPGGEMHGQGMRDGMGGPGMMMGDMGHGMDYSQ
ncbi:MAG: hypothetical protein HQK55_04915 [Deltaproteobacteria bacterium]|nr:hypothetical protein [Deltaproteobacteria bacterium]